MNKQIQREELTPGAEFLLKKDGTKYTVGYEQQIGSYPHYRMNPTHGRGASMQTLAAIRRYWKRPT